MDTEEQLKFVKKWKANNKVYFNNCFGTDNRPQCMFLMGILFTPSSSKHLVVVLQYVIQADTAHSSYRKYTLFLAGS